MKLFVLGLVNNKYEASSNGIRDAPPRNVEYMPRELTRHAWHEQKQKPKAATAEWPLVVTRIVAKQTW